MITDLLLNLIVFYFFTQLSFFSIIGFGNLIFKDLSKNLWINNFVYFIIGIVALSLVGQILYYFNLDSKFNNLLLIFLGLIFFDYKKNKTNIKLYCILNLIFFSGLLISKLHEDWSYHFDFIRQLSIYNPIIGIGNVSDIHILSSSFFIFLQKIFYLPYFDFKLIFIPVYLIYLNILIVLIILSLDKDINLKFLSLSILSLLIVKFSRLSEFGYDYIANIILLKILVIFIYNYYSKFKVSDSSLIYLILFIYSISVKITSLFFIPIFIYIFFYKNNFEIINKNNLFIIIIFVCLAFESISRSGCFMYFAEFTCVNKKYIPWAIDFERIINHSFHVELWSKGFYHQEIIDNKILYLNNFNWVSNWINIHFFYKVFEFIILPIIFLIIYIFLIRFKIFPFKNYIFFISCICSISIWFVVLPQLRFGTAVIICFFISIFFLIDKKIFVKLDTKKIMVFITLLFFIYNAKNINRIYHEFNRNDDFKFVNFPYPPKSRINHENQNKNDINFRIYIGKNQKKYKWLNIIY